MYTRRYFSEGWKIKTETKVIKAKSNQAFRRQVVSTSLILLFVSY